MTSSTCTNTAGTCRCTNGCNCTGCTSHIGHGQHAPTGTLASLDGNSNFNESARLQLNSSAFNDGDEDDAYLTDSTLIPTPPSPSLSDIPDVNDPLDAYLATTSSSEPPQRTPSPTSPTSSSYSGSVDEGRTAALITLSTPVSQDPGANQNHEQAMLEADILSTLTPSSEVSSALLDRGARSRERRWRGSGPDNRMIDEQGPRGVEVYLEIVREVWERVFEGEANPYDRAEEWVDEDLSALAGFVEAEGYVSD